MSRQSEKFRFEQSRKFLLTALRLKDGTNRNEPGGARRTGLVETSQGWKHDAAKGSAEPGRERSLGTDVAEADEPAGRCGGGARVAGAGVESQDRGEDTSPGRGDSETARLARLRADLRQRAASQAPPP